MNTGIIQRRTKRGHDAAAEPPARLRVLIANEGCNRLQLLSVAIVSRGHDVAAVAGSSVELIEQCNGLEPDIVLVGRGDDDEEGLALIAAAVHDGGHPAIALLPSLDLAYIREAARRGAFGYVTSTDPNEIEAAIEIARARFSQYRSLQQAFARRAIVEQAKGILMVQRGIGQDAAFDLLRNHARRTSRKVVDVAEAVVASHGLLITAD